MQSVSQNKKGFTLIELLTVIAIIAVLVAILFPIVGTVREQARQSSCITRLHQLWVAASVYKQDEGAYPPTLLGLAERLDGSYVTIASEPHVDVDRLVGSVLYGDQIKDINLLRCPDNPNTDKSQITVAHFPPRPANWPSNQPYIGDGNGPLAALCGADQYGVIDCHTEGPLMGVPKYYYVWDSYSIGPYIDPTTGEPVRDIYSVRYSRDWTGPNGTGLTDLPNQLKYQNPPSDRTILTACTWHAITAHSNIVTSISLAGTAKKIDLKKFLLHGPNVYSE